MGIEGAPKGSRLLYYPVSVRKQAMQALLDSGASVNCIDADLANRAGGVNLQESKGRVVIPGQKTSRHSRDYRT